MTEAKQAVLIPRCILTRGLDCKSNASSNDLEEVLRVLADSKAGIIQLPCPHQISMIEYDRDIGNRSIRTSLFAKRNRNNTFAGMYSKMLTPVIHEIEKCERKGLHITGLIGVKNSPSCSIKNPKNATDGKFMEVLLKKLKERRIQVEMANI